MRTLMLYTVFNSDELVAYNIDSHKTYESITMSSKMRLESLTYQRDKVFCRALMTGNAPIVFISNE